MPERYSRLARALGQTILEIIPHCVKAASISGAVFMLEIQFKDSVLLTQVTHSAQRRAELEARNKDWQCAVDGPWHHSLMSRLLRTREKAKEVPNVFYRNTTFAAIFLMGGMVSLKSHDQGFTILTIGNLGTSTWTSTFGTFGCIFSQWGKVTAWRPSTLEPDRFFPIFFWGVSLVMFWRLGGGFMMPCWRFEEVIGQVSMEVHSMDNFWKVSIPWRAAPCTAQLPNQPPLSDSTGWWFRNFELRNAPPKWPLN